MNFINQLQKHKIVEVNKLSGLLGGRIVAQAPFYTDADWVDNGWIMFLNADGELVLAEDADFTAQPFLHYTEELMDGPVSGYEFFTVDVQDGVCYPRAIALEVGDEFTTNNIANLDAFDGWDAPVYAVLDDNDLVLTDTAPETGLVFAAFKDRLPAGQPAARLVVVNKA